MKIEVKYAEHIDLIFHALAYLKVNNASNLYSHEYIAEYKNDISREMNILQEYYNNHFGRLMMINFLPFRSGSFEELKDILSNYPNFSEDDKINFIEPFIKILDNERESYFKHWNNIHAKNQEYRKLIEQALIKEFEKYSRVFDYYDKSALIYLSHSITKNGRGFYTGTELYFTALAPFPENNIKYTFFQLFHEITHQFTDKLLQNINMRDGSHNLSESIVILADYYFIKAIDKNNLTEYFKWLASIMNRGGVELTEELFLEIFDIGEELNKALKNLVNKILGK